MSPGVPHRILAVDDVPSNLLTIQAILPTQEFFFLGASGAEEAFGILKEFPVDLILLDVVLPDIDGYEIARRLKASPATASIPVIFLTALKNEDEIVKGFEVGGVDFISKPFHPTELLLRLRTHLALKDKNEALERAAADLRLANQSRDRFFSILAHDLRNPFVGFLSLLEVILSRPDAMSAEELQQSLVSMGHTAQNVYRLLETLLDWGRSQTGGLSLEIQALFLPFLVEEALEPLELSFRKKQITVSIETPRIMVMADRYTVVSILRNLLSNAMKFTKPGGRVTVGAQTEGGRVSIAVSDTGVGIPAQRIPLLFRLENKVSTPGTAREPGTGLGLILCAEFAEKNHGDLSVESVCDVGTTFTLELPAAPEGDL